MTTSREILRSHQREGWYFDYEPGTHRILARKDELVFAVADVKPDFGPVLAELLNTYDVAHGAE